MYLLLRNNKQSGPYSLEEMKSMGLKAYDLVWLEGKSAAWRYPCEVDELKEFAPPVDEQPFDRFYRRPSAVNAAASTTVAGAALSVKAADTAVPVTIEPTKTSGKRIIYVTMPAGRGMANATPVREAAREVVQPMREPAREAAQDVVQPFREPVQPLREPAREAAREVEQPMREVVRKSSQKARMIRFLAIGFCILALLLAGIFIGLSLNKDTLPFSSRVVAKIPPTGTDPSIVRPTAQQMPAPASVNPAVTSKPVDSSAIVNRPAAPAPVIAKPAATPITTPGTLVTTASAPTTTASTPITTARNPKWVKGKTSRSLSQANAALKKDSTAGSGVREAVHRADVEPQHHDNVELPDKEAVKMTVASQVSVGTSGYSVGTFGGISGLQLTVTNRSAYPLDLVIVEVQYIQANKKIYKTENLYFRGVGAGSALMQEAPKSSRGVKVQYRITNISSKELGLSYSGI